MREKEEDRINKKKKKKGKKKRGVWTGGEGKEEKYIYV